MDVRYKKKEVYGRSHPTRGGWIEIMGRDRFKPYIPGRTPHGVRGLKFPLYRLASNKILSHPTRGAWIEIPFSILRPYTFWGRTPHGVRGLK